MSCLKNGSIAKKHTIEHVKKNLSQRLLTLLWEEGYISGFEENVVEKGKIKIFLKYSPKKEPSIKNIIPISKPGKRVYCSVETFWKIDSKNKLVVVSTIEGLKSLEYCKKNRLGGEVLLAVM